MKVVSLILLLVSLTFCWYPEEKYHSSLHYGISAGLTVGSYIYFDNLYPYSSKNEKLITSIFISLLVGLGKEVYDNNSNGEFSMSDMGYNTLGNLSGTVLILKWKF